MKMTIHEANALAKVMDYLWDDEKKDSESLDNPTWHIFRELKVLNQWYCKNILKS